MASSPPKAETRRPSKNDAAVTEKLHAAMARIRGLELTVGVTGLLVGFLVYGQVLALIDLRWPLPEVVRQALLQAFLATAAGWSYLTIYQPLRYGINPYYAARVVEESTPGTRNGLLNWLDLRSAGAEAASARQMVGQRAAKEVEKADLEKVIDGEKATWTSVAAVLLFLFAFILALLVGPRNLLESLGRVFLPFTATASTTAPTEITIVRPQGGGDGTVLVGQPATITVQLSGRIPKATDRDAPRIRYRHGDSEPWRERPMEVRENDDTWEAEIPPTEIENGIDYEVTAGNATTPLHRISVIAAPLIEDFRATYHFRHYTGRTFEVRRERAIEGLQGTEVELTVRTNRTLTADSPKLEMTDLPSGTKVIAGTILPDDPRAFRVKLTLQESGHYRLFFASTRGDTYSDPQKYPLTAIPDEVPQVELTHPARDVQLAANGLLLLEGWAGDKEGLKNLTLRLGVVDGPKLRPILYREMETLRQKHGFYPTFVKYRERLDLTKLRDEAGKPFKPEVKQKIEYWLEAVDASDLPGGPHVVASKKYVIEVIEVDPNGQGQAEQRQQADKDQANHEKQQDQALAEEDAARKDENDRKEKTGQGDPSKDQQPGDNGQQGDKPDPMNQQQGNQGEQGKNPDPKNQQNGNQGEQKKEEEKTLNDAERIKDALEKKEQEGKQPGKGKEQGKEKEQGGESKQGGEQKKDPAESKEGATGEQKEQAGQGKEEGKQPQDQKKPAECKQGSQQGMGGGQQENKAEGKQGGQQSGMNSNQPQAGENKPGEKPNEGKPGQGREGKGTGQEKAGERKEGTNPTDREGAAQGKDASGQGRETSAEPKNAPPTEQPGQGKEGGEKSNTPAPPTGKENPGSGENKPGEPGNPMQPPREGMTQGSTSKPGTNTRDLDPREARPEDVEALKKQAGEPTKERSEAAGRELERIQKEANDPKTREAARQALEETKKNEGSGAKPGENRPGGQDMGMNTTPGGEKKPAGTEGMAGGPGAKPEPGMGQKPGEKAEPKDPAPAGPGGMGGQPMQAEDGPRGKGMNEVPAGGNTPGMGIDRQPGTPDGPQGGGQPEAVKPEQAAPTRPTELQLQKFKDAVTPDVLKNLRMSPEDFAKFLKKYEEMAHRPVGPGETLPPSQPGTGSLPALSGGNRPGTGTGSTPTTGPGTIERPQAPPGYSEAYAEFLRRLAKPERP